MHYPDHAPIDICKKCTGAHTDLYSRARPEIRLATKNFCPKGKLWLETKNYVYASLNEGFPIYPVINAFLYALAFVPACTALEAVHMTNYVLICLYVKTYVNERCLKHDH